MSVFKIGVISRALIFKTGGFWAKYLTTIQYAKAYIKCLFTNRRGFSILRFSVISLYERNPKAVVIKIIYNKNPHVKTLAIMFPPKEPDLKKAFHCSEINFKIINANIEKPHTFFSSCFASFVFDYFLLLTIFTFVK